MKTKNIAKQFSLILLLGLLSCNESKPQTASEIEAFQLKTQKENLRTMFLGAINFCSETDYESYFENPRKLVSSRQGGNCCTNIVGFPYINLAEYYIYSMEGDRSIYKNKDNPFKLKEVRDEWQSDVEKARKEAQKVDPKNLVYKGFRKTSAATYDINSEKLKLNFGSTMVSFGGVQGDWHGSIDFRYKGGKNPSVSELGLSPKEAEKLFEYFENNNNRPGLPSSKRLNTKITYALEKPKNDNGSGIILVDVKKVEYYYPDNWDKKIGEITF